MAITNLIALINTEEAHIEIAKTNSEKAERINNIIQLKLHSSIPQLVDTLYVDVKNFISFYIQSLREKQYNYDEFNEAHIINLINQFSIEKQCNLILFTLREIKNASIPEKAIEFEKLLHRQEFLCAWKKRSLKNILNIIIKASLYNTYTICGALILCFLFCYFIYLPAPDGWPVIFNLNYLKVSDNFIFNHSCNILMSIFDIQNDKFVQPTNIYGTILLITFKCFFLLIIVNVLIDQFKNRFNL